MDDKEKLFKHLEKETKVLQNKLVRQAFSEIDRKDFISSSYECEAYEDYALSIGEGQTISQPTTVAFMLELLDAKEGDRVLDIGSGSGWTTALLSKIVGEEGYVFGVEKIPALAELGQENIRKYNLKNADIRQSGEDLGLEEKGPFDRILVSASSNKIPIEIIDQLEVGGVMVIPVKNSLIRLEKTSATEVAKQEFPGFVFVPLVP